jgi:hypothetical protein
MKPQKTLNSQNNAEEKEQRSSIIISDFKTYYKAIINKTARY